MKNLSRYLSVEVHKGANRLVLIPSVFPSLVIKVPIFRLRYGVKVLISERRQWFRKTTWDETTLLGHRVVPV